MEAVLIAADRISENDVERADDGDAEARAFVRFQAREFCTAVSA
jgi:hypothetical protein